MWDLSTGKEHQDLLPRETVPLDVVGVHVRLEGFVGQLIPLHTDRRNPDRVAGKCGDSLAAVGNGFHGIPDRSRGTFRLERVSVLRPSHALDQIIGIRSLEVLGPLGPAEPWVGLVCLCGIDVAAVGGRVTKCGETVELGVQRVLGCWGRRARSARCRWLGLNHHIMRSGSRCEHLLACDWHRGLGGGWDTVLKECRTAEAPVLLHCRQGTGDIPACIRGLWVTGNLERLDGAYQSIWILGDPGNGCRKTCRWDVGIALRSSVPLLDHACNLLTEGRVELLMLVVEVCMALFGPNSDFALRTDNHRVVLGWCKWVLGHVGGGSQCI